MIIHLPSQAAGRIKQDNASTYQEREAMIGLLVSILQRGKVELICLNDLCKITHSKKKNQDSTQVFWPGGRSTMRGAIYFYTKCSRWLYFYSFSASHNQAFQCNFFDEKKWVFSLAAFNGIEWRWTLILVHVSNCSSLSNAGSTSTLPMRKVRCRLLKLYVK